MKFGVRQIANVVFRANHQMKIGNKTYVQGQPVFYLDTAKTSSMESSTTSVYATGGRGNTRLIAWEGEKVLTFTVEDALLSPISFSILSGAGVVKGLNSQKVHFHQVTTVQTKIETVDGTPRLIIDLTGAIGGTDTICVTAPIYIMDVEEDGDLTGAIESGWGSYAAPASNPTAAQTAMVGKALMKTTNVTASTPTKTVLVDYYVLKAADRVTELQIDAGSFGGNFYVEADTLFRRQIDGVDLPANLTFPNVKIQSNFTFSMAASGDPSTFSFTMDALPAYTYFDKTKKVLCAIQFAEDGSSASTVQAPLFPHPAGNIVESYSDSVDGTVDGETDEAPNS